MNLLVKLFWHKNWTYYIKFYLKLSILKKHFILIQLNDTLT